MVDDTKRVKLDSGQVSTSEELDYLSEGVKQYTSLLEQADPKAIALQMALWKASHVQLLANSRAIRALDLPVEVSGSRLAILRVLYFALNKEMSLSELARQNGMSVAMISHLAERLAKAGLLRKVGSSDDRRVSIAQLTPAGEEAFHQILPVLGNRMIEACKVFSDSEKDQLIQLLQRLF